MTSVVLGIGKRIMEDARLYYRLKNSREPRAADPLLLTALGNQGIWALQAHKLAHYMRHPQGRKTWLWWLARLMGPLAEYLTAICCKSEIIAECQMGKEVYLSNKGHIICGALSIGAGTIIHDHCTLGESVADGLNGRPTIGRKVWIGPNCILAGALTVGDGATILPGTFLTFSVNPGALVQGNPARVVAGHFDNASLLKSAKIVGEELTQPQ